MKIRVEDPCKGNERPEGQKETPAMLRKLIAATFVSLLVAAAAWAEPVTYVLSTPGVV
jgi:hypothetical protein